MKRKNFIFVFVAVMAFGFMSCNNNDCVIPKDINNDQAFVLATHKTGLTDGVDSIQVITTGHSLFEEFISFHNAVSAQNPATRNAVSLRNAVLSDVAIFYYENNKKALLVGDQINNIVYAYIVKTDTRDLFNVFAISIIDSSILDNDEFLDKDEFDDPVVEAMRRRWGTCMSEAVPFLFNDWEDDPIFTSFCWVFAPFCVAGAGLACMLQSAGVEPRPRENIDNILEIQHITVVIDMSAVPRQ